VASDILKRLELEFSGTFVTISNSRLTQLQANSPLCSMLGREIRDFSGQPLDDAYHRMRQLFLWQIIYLKVMRSSEIAEQSGCI
jgi:hypothetical protein